MKRSFGATTADEGTPPRPHPPAATPLTRLSLWGTVSAGGFLLSLSTVLGFGGRFWWFADLFAHFRVQYLVGLAVVALVFLLRRRRKQAAVYAGFAVVNLALITPLYFGRPAAPDSPGPTYRALLLNVGTKLGDPARVAELIAQQDPDLLVLEEVSTWWMEQLDAALHGYPHRVVHPRSDNFGIAFLSKLPLADAQVLWLGGAGLPTVHARIASPDGAFTVIATHPMPPGGAEVTRMRDAQLAALPAVVASVEGPVLLLGDLNTTPWSHAFHLLRRESRLRDSARGFGLQPTWPTTLWPLFIPLDHCLHSPGIHIVDRWIGDAVGSDHLPLVVDFAVPGD